jgi:hypothetical protein
VVIAGDRISEFDSEWAREMLQGALKNSSLSANISMLHAAGMLKQQNW